MSFGEPINWLQTRRVCCQFIKVDEPPGQLIQRIAGLVSLFGSDWLTLRHITLRTEAMSHSNQEFMKKSTVLAAFVALFAFASCSDNSQNTAESHDHDHEHHDAMAHGDNLPAAGTVVVETPSYTSVPEPMQRNLSQMLDEYITLTGALVEADADAAKEAASAVLNSANAMPVATIDGEQKAYAEKQIDIVRNSSAAIAGTADLAEQRNNLEALSEAVFSLTKAFNATDEKVYYQHCPMVNNNQGAYWVSTNSEIRNPYFGSSMLKCGSNEEVYN
jgi:Cu(I)/Ag(I) efflux system membrane fusion protein